MEEPPTLPMLPPSAIAKVLSYCLEDFWELAQCRSWSKHCRDEVVPLILAREKPFLKCLKSLKEDPERDHYLHTLIKSIPDDANSHYGTALLEGEKWIFTSSGSRFSGLFPGATVKDCLVVKKMQFEHYIDLLGYMEDHRSDEQKLEWNEGIAHDSHAVQDFEDLPALSDLEWFAPYAIHDLEKFKEVAVDDNSHRYLEDSALVFLTLVVPKHAICRIKKEYTDVDIINGNDTSDPTSLTDAKRKRTVLLRVTDRRAPKHPDEDDGRGPIYPEDELAGSTFVGHVVEDAVADDRSTVVVRVAIQIKFHRTIASYYDWWNNEFLHEVWDERPILVESLYLDGARRKHQRQPPREGVAVVDGVLPRIGTGLNRALDNHNISAGIDTDGASALPLFQHGWLHRLSETSAATSRVTTNFDLPVRVLDDAERNDPVNATKRGMYDQANANEDFWGRKHDAEGVVDQHGGLVDAVWTPTNFSIAKDGSCTIASPIHPRLSPWSQHRAIHQDLQSLFEVALPLLESVYGYACQVRRHVRTDDQPESSKYYQDNGGQLLDEPYLEQTERCSLRGRDLEVVTGFKEFPSEDAVNRDHVFNVVGVAEEEIVATAIYVLDKSPNQEPSSGQVKFQRAFHKTEARYAEASYDGAHGHPVIRDRLLAQGILPLGQVETLKNRLIAFPNCNVYKISELQTLCGSTSSADNDKCTQEPPANQPKEIPEGGKGCEDTKPKLRLLFFHLVNPLKSVVPGDGPADSSKEWSKESHAAMTLEIQNRYPFSNPDFDVPGVRVMHLDTD